METKKIPCKTVYIVSDNAFDDAWLFYAVYDNKPKRKRVTHHIYKFKNYRELNLNSNEVESYKNEILNKIDFFAQNQYRKFIKKVTQHDTFDFNSYEVPFCENEEIYYRPSDHFAIYSASSITKRITLEPPFYYFDLEDAEEVPFSKQELKEIEEIKSQKADLEVINSMLLPSLNMVLQKYGLEKRSPNGGIYFKNYKEYTKVVRDLFEKSIIKDLYEAGFDCKLSKTRSIKWTDCIIDEDSIRLKHNDDNGLD